MKKFCLLLAALLCLCAAASAQGLPGGWSVTEDIALTDDARAALETALADYEGAEVTPVALLGTQVVSGMNYAVLCRVIPAAGPGPLYAVAYVYAALDGTCQLVGFDDVDLDMDFGDDFDDFDDFDDDDDFDDLDDDFDD